MIPFIRRLLWDDAAFERYGRAAIMAACMYLGSTGALPHWAEALGAALSMMIGAGEKNPPPIMPPPAGHA